MKYLILIIMGLSFFNTTALAQRYSVIVNAENAISGSEDYLRAQVRLLFLKQKTEWPDGKIAIPSALPVDNEGLDHFRKDVLNMSRDDLERHWLRLRQLSGEVPPREFRSNRMVIRHVARSPGAMGIAESLFVKSNPDVRVLFELDGE